MDKDKTVFRNKMIYQLLITLMMLKTAAGGQGICDSCFDGICYSRSQIYKEHKVSGQLDVDRKENLLYFHYEVSEEEDRTVAFDLDDIRFLTVPNIGFSFGRTVNQETRDVFIGGSTGIYKFNPKTNITILYGLNDKTIWNMHYKDVLYYTTFLNKGLFVFEGKHSRNIAALNDFVLDDFVVDKKDDIYFISNFTMYVLKKGDKIPIIISNVTYSMAVDVFGNAYFVQRETRGLYKIDSKNKLVDVGAFGSGNLLRFVFDRYNNIIYYDIDTNNLFYLVPTYALCEVMQTEGLARRLKMVSRL